MIAGAISWVRSGENSIIHTKADFRLEGGEEVEVTFLQEGLRRQYRVVALIFQGLIVRWGEVMLGGNMLLMRRVFFMGDGVEQGGEGFSAGVGGVDCCGGVVVCCVERNRSGVLQLSFGCDES